MSGQSKTTPELLDDIQAIQRLIDAACFTNNDNYTAIRTKAEDALQRIMEKLNVYI